MIKSFCNAGYTIIFFLLLFCSVHAACQTPSIFAPGVISGPLHDSAPAFAPDGKRVYFSRSNSSHSTILLSYFRKGKWSDPELASFAGQWNDLEPAMSPDGSYLIFVSNRPVLAGGAPLDGSYNGKVWPGRGGNLWRVDRQGASWGQPYRLPDLINSSTSTFGPSITADGTIYFMHPSEETGRFRIFRARKINGTYQTPELMLSEMSVKYSDVDPAVAADGSFIVFGSTRPPAAGMDLFIAFRKGDSWGEPIHLGKEINSTGSDAEARLGPDQQTLFFSSERTQPVAFPQTREIAGKILTETWDNGLYNIWSVSISKWLNERRP
jgi:WD40-like Beta Propeller Repeat